VLLSNAVLKVSTGAFTNFELCITSNNKDSTNYKYSLA
jgi:hypothetical protein